MRCIGAPIWDHGGGDSRYRYRRPARRMTYARLEELRPAVLKAAEGISQCMGFCVC